MEAWTSGKVSGSARQCWLKYGPYQRADMFGKDGTDWRMCGWESEIDLCRAMGRGVRSGANKPAHKYDAVPPMMIQVGNHFESNPAYYKRGR